MRIKRVECDQFAGVLDKSINFEDGLNLIIGDNESGKSTMVDLIYHMLFKSTKLDGRSDAEFIDRYFPKMVSGPDRNCIDGTLVFHTEDGVYKLKKEWEKGDGSCRLILPDGTSVKGDEVVRNALSDIIKHRAGVYNEIVFASQKREQKAVESILRSISRKTDSLSDTREDLTSALSQASLETGGVSIERIEKSIRANIDNLIGRWDELSDSPEGGPKRASYKNKWANGIGTIAKAYYEMDEVREKYNNTKNAEEAVENIKGELCKSQDKKSIAENELLEFHKIKGKLEQLSMLIKVNSDLKNKIEEKTDIINKWPQLDKNLELANNLQKKLELSAKCELYKKASKANDEYLKSKEKLAGLKEVDLADIRTMRDLTSKIMKEEGRLSGLNLSASINTFGDYEAKIKSLCDESDINKIDGKYQINEAVKILVPDVIEVTLMPGGVDAEEIKQNIKNYSDELKIIQEKYNIKDIEQLAQMSDMYVTAKADADKKSLVLEGVLGSNTFECIENAAKEIPDGIQSAVEISAEISKLCGNKSVEAYIGAIEQLLSDYEAKYEGLEQLIATKLSDEAELSKNQQKLEELDEIPKEFREIEDADAYANELNGKIADLNQICEDLLAKLRASEREILDKSSEEYLEDLSEKQTELEAKKAELEHWKHIYQVFCQIKQSSVDNPVKDIEKNFREYLKIITDGTLSLDSMDERLGVQLASKTHSLTYDILSDGTKDAISLAFRLSMLEHLYPDGNGLAVFDDPFTDMDPKRAELSCELIQKFAQNNQVIFITCDDKYKEMLSGNIVRI